MLLDRVNLLERMSTTLRPSGLSRVVSEQMGLLRRRAETGRYGYLGD